MFALFRSISLRDLARQRGQSILVAASIALGVVAWTTTWTLNDLLDKTLHESGVPAAGADLFVTNSDAGLPAELVEELKKIDGVASARGVVIQRIRLRTSAAAAWQSANLIGIDIDENDASENNNSLKFSPGTAEAFMDAMIGQKNPVIAGADTKRLGIADGQSFQAILAGRGEVLTCVGRVESSPELEGLTGAILITGTEQASALCGRPDRLTRIDLEIQAKQEIDQVQERVAAVLGHRAEVVTARQQEGRTSESLDALRAGFAMCGFGALGLAMFLISTVLGVSVAQRSRTIGLLRSIGCTRPQIYSQILAETLLLGLAGSVAGVAVGYGLAVLVSGPMLKALGDVFMPLESRDVSLDMTIAIQGMAAGLTTSLASAILPSLRASRLSPTLAMKRARVEPHFSYTLRSLFGIALAVLAGWLYGSRADYRDFRSIYGALASGLLAFMVLVPLLTNLLAVFVRPLAETIAGTPGRLAVESIKRSPARTGSTIAGLAGGVALMIQTGGVIQGNERAVCDWVDQCISGDLFVTSGGPMSASGRTIPMENSLAGKIAETLPGSCAVAMQFLHMDWNSRGQMTRILMLSLDATTYVQMTAQRQPPLKDHALYQKLQRRGTVLVSENFATINRVGVGSTIRLPGLDGPVALEVIGTVVDFSNNRGTVIVDRNTTGQLFGATWVDHFAVGVPRTIDPDSARSTISQAPWAVDSAIDVMTRPALREHILGMIRKLYGVAYIQELVAAAVAALGVSSSMLICVLQRRRELAMLRAIGATANQLFTTVLAEAVIMALIGTALGLILGISLEWYVLRVVLLMETGFEFPVVVPWADVVMIGGLISLASIVAGWFPARSATRIPVSIALARG